MYSFWTVMKLELFLIWRNWATWLIALAMLVSGLLVADNNRNQPWGVGLFLTLILTFSTGNQVNRDRERRLDSVVLSTPILTMVYVLAKYSASLLSLPGLLTLNLLTALLADQFYNAPQQVLFLAPVIYPSPGSQVYLLDWLWVLLVPVIFGTTLMLACTTLTQGKRVVAYTATLLVWLIPVFAISSDRASFFDITAMSFTTGANPAANFWFQHHPGGPASLPLSQFVQQIIPLARANVPPAPLLASLLWNRLFFLGLTLILLYLTILSVQRARRNV